MSKVFTSMCNRHVYFFDTVDEAEISELEKQYWSLKGTSKSGRFDIETFTAVISPPMPQSLCAGLFYAVTCT